MERFYEFVRSSVVNFKLESCCWLAPIRIGVLIIGYYNSMLSLIYVLGSAEDSLTPTLKKVQEKITEDEATGTMCILAYTIEFGFSVLLIAAMHRNDVVLLRVYMYYSIAVMVMSLILYALVIVKIDVLIKIVIIFTTLFQCYVIVLVRSAIVEIREAATYNFNPRFSKRTYKVDMNNLNKRNNTDVEAPEEPPQSRVEPESQNNSQIQPQSQSESHPRTLSNNPHTAAENPSETQAQSQIEARSKSQPNSQSQLEERSESQTNSQSQLEVRSESQPNSQSQLEARLESQPESQSQSQSETQTVTEPSPDAAQINGTKIAPERKKKKRNLKTLLSKDDSKNKDSK